MTHAHSTMTAARLQDRLETRWILPVASYSRLRALIRAHFRPITYSDRPWTHTLFFNNDSHDLPPEMSIKLRRYVKKPIRGKFHPREGTWFLETKETNPENIHHVLKKRVAITLQQAMARFSRRDSLRFFTHGKATYPLNSPLRLYTAIEYRREHFINKRAQCRITLDRDTRFWHQLEEGTWIPLGQEHGIRLEFKCLPEFLATPQWRRLLRMLLREKALPVIGKRYAALNRVSTMQRSLVPLPLNEAPGLEYGMSFDLSNEQIHALSARLFRLFQRHPRFSIIAHRPWLTENGLVRIYFGKSLRLNLYGDSFRWVRAPAPKYPVSVRLVRRPRQVKSEYRMITPFQIKDFFSRHRFLGVLLQNRRQFWVEDRKKRVFQISVFRSLNFSSHAQLTQVDLQYIGRTFSAEPRNQVKEIERKLYALSLLIKAHFGGLRPARRSLLTFAAMKKNDVKNPIAQVPSRLGKQPHRRIIKNNIKQ